MTKEKQIEEMAKDLENHTCMSQFQAEIASKMLHIKGYRKASEVAREIFEDLEKNMITYGEVESAVYYKQIGYNSFAELKKKYTEGEG